MSIAGMIMDVVDAGGHIAIESDCVDSQYAVRVGNAVVEKSINFNKPEELPSAISAAHDAWIAFANAADGFNPTRTGR